MEEFVGREVDGDTFVGALGKRFDELEIRRKIEGIQTTALPKLASKS